MPKQIYTLENVDVDKLPVRCMKCRKAPRLCICTEYRIENTGPDRWTVVADNIATDPVRGESVGTWQPRRNARIWRRPQFVDGIYIATITNPNIVSEMRAEIEKGTFHVTNWEQNPAVRVPEYDKAFRRRLSVFRKPRGRK